MQLIKFILLTVVLVMAFSLAVMLLWNWLVPALFDGPTINLPEAVGLLALVKILLSFGRGGWGGGKGRQGRAWKKSLRSKWAQMSPEEKEKFRHGFVKECISEKKKKRLETA